ncbi:MAG: hypothetical protein ABW019_05295 [Chitinophagaceae bacterium]
MKSYFVSLLALVLLAGCSKQQDDDYANNPDVPAQLHNRPVGASASELLAAAKYTSLTIEVQYMTGYAPDAAALSYLQSMLGGLVNKPAGISIVTKEIAGAASQTLSANDIAGIEQANRTVFTSGSRLGVYVLYTNGSYTSGSTLGIAYRNTSIALFGKKIHDNSGGIGQTSRTKLEATVLGHELGHLLGLVDLGSPMQANHKDSDHGNHCSNSNCLMYYASETTDVLGFLLTGNVPPLDAGCRADLHANGGQ